MIDCEGDTAECPQDKSTGGTFLGAPADFLLASARAVCDSGFKRGALLPVLGQGLDGEIVLLPGSLSVMASGSDQLGHAAAHFRELLSEGPIPAGLCDKLPQTLARRAIQDTGPLNAA